MPAPVDLSFERFLRQPSPRREPLCKPDHAPRYQPKARADDDDSEIDELRDIPSRPTYTTRSPSLHPHIHRQNLHVDRTIDEDYDGMDGSSDTEPVPQTPLSERASLDTPDVREDTSTNSPAHYQDEGESVMDVDDPPTPSSDDMHPQEHPSIATIEDEERPLGRDDSPSDPGSPNGSKVPIQRPKYRSYRDQHSTVPMPCLIDQCSHTSWMPKEREKHMDTHFHKRWQCGSCKKWYSTSYTLKRHSDSTHVPDACKGGYEAGNYASVPPYWTMPEYIHRVRMPEPTDYLYPALAPVFKKREELLASGLLNKRPLPDDLRVSASEAPRKRVKRRAMRKPVEDDQKPLADVSMNMHRAESAAPLDRHDRERSASVSPATELALEMQKPHTPGMHPKQEPRAAVASIEHLKLPPVPSVSICTEKARDLCLRLWLVDHPKGAIIEFERYWNGVTGEERKAYEILSKAREQRNE